MSRQLFITIHLYLSSFFAAAVVLVAISGGLYLIGIKGTMERTDIATIDGGEALMQDPSKAAVSSALARAGIEDFSFDYVRAGGSRLYTRPTSERHYVLTVEGDAVTVTESVPDLQGRMIELHKGHGPTLFKNFQMVFAAGMVFVILSGLWLGLSSSRLRRNTAVAGFGGLLVFVALVLA